MLTLACNGACGSYVNMFLLKKLTLYFHWWSQASIRSPSFPPNSSEWQYQLVFEGHVFKKTALQFKFVNQSKKDYIRLHLPWNNANQTTWHFHFMWKNRLTACDNSLDFSLWNFDSSRTASQNRCWSYFFVCSTTQSSFSDLNDNDAQKARHLHCILLKPASGTCVVSLYLSMSHVR